MTRGPVAARCENELHDYNAPSATGPARRKHMFCCCVWIVTRIALSASMIETNAFAFKRQWRAQVPAETGSWGDARESCTALDTLLAVRLYVF
jgi:hypothetical protein